MDYQRTTTGALVPRQVVNPPSVWYIGGAYAVAMDDEDSQYRTVTSHVNVSAQNSAAGSPDPPLIKVAGVFDPARIRSFDPLSQVPLGDYQPVVAAPAPRPAGGRCTGVICCPARTWVAWSASR